MTSSMYRLAAGCLLTLALLPLLAGRTPASAQNNEQSVAQNTCNAAFATAIASTTGVRNRMFVAAYEEWKFFGQQVVEYAPGAEQGRIVAGGWLEDGEQAKAGYLPKEWETNETNICIARRKLISDGKTIDGEGEKRVQRVNAYWRVVAAQLRRDGEMVEANRYENFDGCSGGVPWSAAFISFVMAKAGLNLGQPMRFRPAPGHPTI